MKKLLKEIYSVQKSFSGFLLLFSIVMFIDWKYHFLLDAPSNIPGMIDLSMVFAYILLVCWVMNTWYDVHDLRHPAKYSSYGFSYVTPLDDEDIDTIRRTILNGGSI